MEMGIDSREGDEWMALSLFPGGGRGVPRPAERELRNERFFGSFARVCVFRGHTCPARKQVWRRIRFTCDGGGEDCRVLWSVL